MCKIEFILVTFAGLSQGEGGGLNLEEVKRRGRKTSLFQYQAGGGIPTHHFLILKDVFSV